MWAQLADLVPTLVMSDILIADALVAHVLHGDVTELPWPAPETGADVEADADAAADAAADADPEGTADAED